MTPLEQRLLAALQDLTNEISGALRADTPLNRARAIFSSYAGQLEQAAMQCRPIGPIEARGLEFEAVKKIAAELGVPELVAALRAVVAAWSNPGPFGTMYQMDRAIPAARAAIAAATSTKDAP
jgi:hypothetical protein